jgi:GNAT superfamily N-acetyltransferase
MLADRALVERVERFFARDCAELARSLHRLEPHGDAEVVERAGGSVVWMGHGMYVNRAFGIGVTQPAAPGDVDAIVEFYDSKGADAGIQLCPYADDRVRARANELGFRVTGFGNFYARRFDDLARPRAEIELVAVEDANFETWAGVWITQSRDAAVERRFVSARYHAEGEHAYLVLHGDEVVAVCSLAVLDGVADLGGMLTLPAARGRGIQAACIAHRLAIAHDLGCDLAVTSAVPGGSSPRNLERAGFECLYTGVGLVRPRESA